EKQWQGMPGVTGDKMPSLAPEFASSAGWMAKRPNNGQFKLPSSGALPPIPSAPLAPAANAASAQSARSVFKPPMTLGSGVRPPISPDAHADSSAQEFRPVSPAQTAQPAPQQPLVTVLASGAQAKQMLPPAQPPIMQNVSPFAAPMANNGYPSQIAGQQYSPIQSSSMQVPDANYAGWEQASNAAMMGMPADPGMQAGMMYNASAYGQQQYNDPAYGQQQYMGAYGQGEWVQGEWVQYEQDLGPAPNRGRRRAVAILGGAVVAAVLGAGGINLLRTMREETPPVVPQGTNTNQTQVPSPVPAGQKPTGQPTPVPVNQQAGPVIANQKNLATNAAQDFTNPTNKHAAILVHLPSGKFAAYDKACTHQGVAVTYDPQTNKLVCPLHHSIFDPADNGKVVQGPAFLRLPAVKIQVNGDGTITVH
nr:Rieske 2Fe-2S domain-containing protein [Ktedonobacteraceae bacterium]